MATSVADFFARRTNMLRSRAFELDPDEPFFSLPAQAHGPIGRTRAASRRLGLMDEAGAATEASAARPPARCASDRFPQCRSRSHAPRIPEVCLRQ